MDDKMGGSNQVCVSGYSQQDLASLRNKSNCNLSLVNKCYTKFK